MRSTLRWRSRLRARRRWCGPWRRCASLSARTLPARPSWRLRRSRCPKCRARCWRPWTALCWKQRTTDTRQARPVKKPSAAPQLRAMPLRRVPERRLYGKGPAHCRLRVGRETFGVPISLVHEIVRVPEITAVPDAPDCIEGVINLRGKIVSVVDLRKRFGEREIRRTKKNRILVVEVQGKMVGLIVDAASEVLKVPPSEVEQPPEVFEEGELNYVTGVGKLKDRLVIMVDLNKILQRGELRKISTFAEKQTLSARAAS